MWQRFTEKARRAVLFAQEEADAMSAGDVGTEHLLLGLLRETKGGAAQVLKERGVTLEAVRSLLSAPKSLPSSEELKLTPKAKRALELSADESRLMRHEHIGTEHLLIALMRDPDTSAARILKRFNLDVEALRVRVINSFADEGRPHDDTALAAPELASTSILPTYGEPEPVRITGRTFKVLQLAHEEARATGALVEEHHLLLGIVSEDEGVTGHVLRQMGVNLKRVRAGINYLISQGELPSPLEKTAAVNSEQETRLSPKAERALDLAADQSRRWRNDFIGPEHLLFVLAKYRNANGPAVKVLRHLNVDLDLLCEQISFYRDPEKTNVIPGILLIEARREAEETDDEDSAQEPPSLDVEAVSPLTPDYRQVLERARELAGKRNSFGLPELLLAVLGRQNSVEVQLLIECGLNLDAARQRLEAQIDEESKEAK